MLKLEAGMLLYHGSYSIVENIDLEKCADNKDFGKGFYLTSSLSQAKKFVRLSINKAKINGSVPEGTSVGYVSVFRVISLDGIKLHYFDGADRKWLHYVASNRRPPLFAKEKAKLDTKNVIAGKIANDRTSMTLQNYISNANGKPGDKIIDELTIQALLPNKLQDQFCFKDEKAVSCLEFVKSMKVNIDE